MTWLEFAPVLLLAVAVLYVPGLALGLAIGARRFTLWATAPAITVAFVSVAAIVFGRLGIDWSLVSVSAAAGAVAIVAGTRGSSCAGGPPRGPRTRTAVHRAGPSVRSRSPRSSSACSSSSGFERPDSISQTFDAFFHLNGIRYIVETGSASSFDLQGLVLPAGQTAFYPAGWHGVTSLVAASADVAIPAAVNAVNLVVATLVWPAGCMLLVRSLAPKSRSAIAAVGISERRLPGVPAHDAHLRRALPLLPRARAAADRARAGILARSGARVAPSRAHLPFGAARDQPHRHRLRAAGRGVRLGGDHAAARGGHGSSAPCARGPAFGEWPDGSCSVSRSWSSPRCGSGSAASARTLRGRRTRTRSWRCGRRSPMGSTAESSRSSRRCSPSSGSSTSSAAVTSCGSSPAGRWPCCSSSSRRPGRRGGCGRSSSASSTATRRGSPRCSCRRGADGRVRRDRALAGGAALRAAEARRRSRARQAARGSSRRPCSRSSSSAPRAPPIWGKLALTARAYTDAEDAPILSGSERALIERIPEHVPEGRRDRREPVDGRGVHLRADRQAHAQSALQFVRVPAGPAHQREAERGARRPRGVRGGARGGSDARARLRHVLPRLR